MSRSGETDDDERFPNEWAFWERRTRQVLSSRNGYRALSELRAALLALPEKRLIARALSTAGKEPDHEKYSNHDELLEEQGSGVCAVGAFAWHQKVKAGADPVEAMASLPLAPDYEGDQWVTVQAGRDAGMSETLAWLVMDANDETYDHLTPEERYIAILAWVDRKLDAYPDKVKTAELAHA